MSNPRKENYRVRVIWQAEGELEVQAWNTEDAYDKAHTAMEKGILPKNTSIDSDSIEVTDAYPIDRSEKAAPTRSVSEITIPSSERVRGLDRTGDRVAEIEKALEEITHLTYLPDNKDFQIK